MEAPAAATLTALLSPPAIQPPSKDISRRLKCWPAKHLGYCGERNSPYHRNSGRRRRLNSAGFEPGRRSQTDLGGGVGGLCASSRIVEVSVGRSVKCVGALNTKAASLPINSNFFSDVEKSDFFSDFFAAAICLQIGQGCWPSKVFDKASPIESVRRFSAIIVVQARPCSAAQCPPITQINAKVVKTLPSRLSTTEVSKIASRKSINAWRVFVLVILQII